MIPVSHFDPVSAVWYCHGLYLEVPLVQLSQTSYCSIEKCWGANLCKPLTFPITIFPVDTGLLQAVMRINGNVRILAPFNSHQARRLIEKQKGTDCGLAVEAVLTFLEQPCSDVSEHQNRRTPKEADWLEQSLMRGKWKISLWQVFVSPTILAWCPYGAWPYFWGIVAQHPQKSSGLCGLCWRCLTIKGALPNLQYPHRWSRS